MSSSLLIENLSPKTDVSNLCEMFGKYGRVLSANIETDSNLQSLCKGHVLYDTSYSAHNAVKQMNGRNHFGRPIYVKYDTTVRTNVDSSQNEYFKKIFVKNFDATWDDYNLVGEFEIFGEIEDAKVSQTDGQSNGYGFVRFQKHSSAKMAVEAMNNKVFNNKILVVKPFTYKDNIKTTTDPNNIVREKLIQLNNLFIKNLPKDMDEDDLRDLFKKCGTILSVRIATDSAHKCKGYGFVCFHDEMMAAKARNQMNGLSYKSKILEVDFYKKPDYNTDSHDKVQEFQPNNLFISNLPKNMEEEELRDLFRKFGPILSVKIATDNAQNSKGYGFVCFHDKTAAAKARYQMNGLNYKSKILEVNFYKKKSDYHPEPKIKETKEQTHRFFPPDKKTVFSFSARG